MTAKPDVLLVTQFYWPEPIGSAPYCTDLAEWMAITGWRTRVLTCRPHYPTGQVPPEYDNGERDRECRGKASIRRLPPWRPDLRGALGRMASETVFLLRGLHEIASRRTARSDHVISLCPSIFTVLLGSVACRRRGCHFALIHDIQSGLAAGLGMVGGRWLVAGMRLLERGILNRVDGIFVLSEDMRRQLRDQGITAPVQVLPIWVDASAIYPVRSAERRTATALYSGNLGRKQALDQVIALADTLQCRGSSMRVIVRGTGSEAQRLARTARLRQLRNIEFRPLVPPEQLNDGLAEGDVHLVPQDRDAADFAVPSKVYGIMAAGRTFVATAGPGSHLWRLQRDTEAFRCVPPGDPQALADAVMALGQDPKLRSELGARGRAYVMARHDKASILGAFESALRTIAQRRRLEPQS